MSKPPDTNAMDGPLASPETTRRSSRGTFKHFFLRGLAILLPTVLTIWILLAAYQFVQGRIAAPINAGLRELVVQATPWPDASEPELAAARLYMPLEEQRAFRHAGETRAWLERYTRREKLERWWRAYAFPMDLIGLAVAITLIYIAGVLLGSFIGRRLYARGEALINRLPLVRRIYPSVKQVTDFFVGGPTERLQFNHVVALEYPRRGIWSLGLVTGESMATVQDRLGEESLTVYVPTAPTPFTGYVVMIRKSDCIELPITVEDAVKYCVSGGVLIPLNQRIEPPAVPEPPVGGPDQPGR